MKYRWSEWKNKNAFCTIIPHNALRAREVVIKLARASFTRWKAYTYYVHAYVL